MQINLLIHAKHCGVLQRALIFPLINFSRLDRLCKRIFLSPSPHFLSLALSNVAVLAAVNPWQIAFLVTHLIVPCRSFPAAIYVTYDGTVSMDPKTNHTLSSISYSLSFPNVGHSRS